MFGKDRRMEGVELAKLKWMHRTMEVSDKVGKAVINMFRKLKNK